MIIPKIQRLPVQTSASVPLRQAEHADHSLITWQKARCVAGVIFSVIAFSMITRFVKAAIRWVVLPSTTFTAQIRQEGSDRFQAAWNGSFPTTFDELDQKAIVQLRTCFTAEQHSVPTPDGAVLDVKLLKPQRQTDEPLPTVIFFNANAEQIGLGSYGMGKDLDLLTAIANGRPSNVVLFDYRGTGMSQGTMTRLDDLRIDGSSVVQWVRETLQTPPGDIHFYGWSLGGAVAVQTKASDPELTGTLISDRSFSSLGAVARSWFGRGVGSLASGLLSCMGYGDNIAQSFRTLKGRTLVIYHPNDRIIPYEASLHNAVGPDSQAFCLGGRELEQTTNHHCTPVSWYRGCREEIIDTLAATHRAEDSR